MSWTTEARFLADGGILLFATKADQDVHSASDAKGNGGSFLKGKAANAGRWLLTSIQYQNLECMAFYLHSPYMPARYGSYASGKHNLPYFYDYLYKTVLSPVTIPIIIIFKLMGN
jgi:hypothetical protein